MNDQQPNYQTPPSTPLTPNSTLAMVSMISGIVGWILAPLLGSLVAIITGHMAKREIRESMGRLGGDGMATAGLVLGYLQIVPSILCICIVLIMLAMGVSIPILDSLIY
ncbi:MAG: DUF4190 domain-containing protein [Anaerolineae bacterium]|jgi:hypothetical protein|nr:DUF4190 domain-containing protein [Anaerolineae bacterium]MBT7072229.1 DUF4190 domain-containing protein [Anaerolineae bacterium]MBT7323977.1 DUF4190 domain-containing protein [Anaerolineae bacterium]